MKSLVDTTRFVLSACQSWSILVKLEDNKGSRSRTFIAKSDVRTYEVFENDCSKKVYSQWDLWFEVSTRTCVIILHLSQYQMAA